MNECIALVGTGILLDFKNYIRAINKRRANHSHNCVNIFLVFFIYLWYAMRWYLYLCHIFNSSSGNYFWTYYPNGYFFSASGSHVEQNKVFAEKTCISSHNFHNVHKTRKSQKLLTIYAMRSEKLF